MRKPTHAWIVGIDDYATYDHTSDRPPGTSDLVGAVEDALTLDRWVRRLGARDVDVWIGPAGGSRSTLAPTRDRLLASLDRMLVRAAADPCSSVRIGFFGHGAVDASGEPVLCPGDVGPGLARAIPVSHIAALLARRLPERPVELWLGAAFGAGRRGEGRGRARTLTPAAPPVPVRLRCEDVVREPRVLSRDAPRRGPRAPFALLVALGIVKMLRPHQIHSTHNGFRICDIRHPDQDLNIGRLVVTDGAYGGGNGYGPWEDHWWWDTSRTEPWPPSFRLVDWSRLRVDFVGGKPPEMPDHGVVEVYEGGWFDAQQRATLEATSGGRLYRLARRSPNGTTALDAFVSCLGQPPGRRLEWHTSELDGDFLPWSEEDELLFLSAGAVEPRERAYLVTPQIG